MAKAVGLDPGEHEVKLVELEGSLRKPRLARVGVVSSPDGPPSAAGQAEAVLRALADSGIGKDGLLMAFPGREAVLRTLNVPFVGREQIRKVIKFEAEGSIHSHNVDDMVVDFLPLAEAATETKVLVAAVPKPPLRAALQSLEKHGVEPEVVDLDAMALFRAAEWCGAFSEDEEEAVRAAESEITPAVATALMPAGGEETAPVLTTQTSAPARLVLDLGARSTRVLVVIEGRIADLRTLRIGADGIAEEVAAATGIDPDQAREAAEESLRTDEDFLLVVESDAEAESVAVADAVPALPARAEQHVVAHELVVAARDRYLQRLRRELMRFVTGVRAESIEAVWITGGASVMPGVADLLADVFGVAPQHLDVLSRLSHKLDPDEAQALAPKLAVAVGMALRGLGGKTGFNFRQEDLAFTRGFDRIKFPLAIASMLALFLVLVFALKSYNELRAKRNLYGGIYKVETKELARGRTDTTAVFYGYVGSLVNPTHWFADDHNFDEREYKKLVDKLIEDDVFDRLPELRRAASLYFRNLQQESGYYSDLRIGSGLGALVGMAETLKKIEPQLGRYLVTEIDLNAQFDDRARRLTFRVALRSDEKHSFREKWDLLERTFEQAAKDPSSPFGSIESGKAGNNEEVFSGDDGTAGAYYQVDIILKPESSYPIFPPKEQP